MSKKILFAALLATVSPILIQPIHAVQTKSQTEDDEAIRQGKDAQNVCYVSFFTENNKYIGGGSGALIVEPGKEPNEKSQIIVTAGHVLHDVYDKYLEEYKQLKDTNGVKSAKQSLKLFRKGNPVKANGFVTFSPDVHQALIDGLLPDQDRNPSHKFYKIRAAIMHPDYNYDDTDAHTDIAFAMLESYVEGITPLALYEDGLFNSNDITSKKLLQTKFTGYGRDVAQGYGKKRSISQICLIEKHQPHDDSGSGSESDSANHSETTSHSESSSDINETSINKNDFVAGITSFCPGAREESTLKMTEEEHLFHDNILKFREKGENYGFITQGDSGGTLTIKNGQGREFLIGIESTPSDDANDLMSISENFKDIQGIERRYATYLCPLFTLDGKLDPTIPEMINKLKSFQVNDLGVASNLQAMMRDEQRVYGLWNGLLSLRSLIKLAIKDAENLSDLDLSDRNSPLTEIEKTVDQFKKITHKVDEIWPKKDDQENNIEQTNTVNNDLELLRKLQMEENNKLYNEELKKILEKIKDHKNKLKDFLEKLPK